MKLICIVACTMAGLSLVHAQDRCSATDLAIKACVRQTLIDSNVVINGIISDPGGVKTKEATEMCQYDCNVSSATFEVKWGSFRKP
jgi:hypothetical protein